MYKKMIPILIHNFNVANKNVTPLGKEKRTWKK